MATVARIVKASLQRILVQADEAPIEASEAQDFIDSMNEYMFALDAEGVTLGYTEVSGLGDEVTIPTGALRGLIANMAIEVSPDYKGAVTGALELAARDGLKVMRILGQRIGRTRYPGTLPVGSGNEGDYGFGLSSHFFLDAEAEILAETTGSISMETDTSGTI